MLDAQLAAVYEEHADYVWANLRRLGVPTPELDDAVQETFIVAFRRSDTVREGASWRPWLFGIARRVASHHRRRRGRRLRLVDAVAREPRAAYDPHDALALRHAAELAHHFLQTLSPRRRDVFILAEIEGHSGAEIAALLGIPQNTVWSRLRAARESFRRFLAVLDARERGAALVEAARRERMPAAHKKKAMALLAVRLGGGSTVLTAFLGVLKPAAISIALGTAALTTITIVAQAGAATPPPRPDAAARVAVEPSPPPVEDVDAPVVEANAGEDRDRPRVGGAPHARVDEGSPGPGETVSGAMHGRRRRPSATRQGAGRGEPVDKSAAIVQELALVEKLWAATKSRSYERALALAAEHRRRFADGELTEERDVVLVEALCGLGRYASARKKIAKLRTPLPKRVAAACEEKPTKPATRGQQQ